MIHLVPVSKKLPEFPAIRALYREAFPPEEQAPFWLLMRKTTLPMTDFWAFYEQETWVGFAYVIQNETLAYLFYLAIAPEQRGKGYGHQAMVCLKEQYASKTLFLSLETLDEQAENYEQRKKRHTFYQQCGLSDLPYQIQEGKVLYDGMGTGGEIHPSDYDNLVRQYLGTFFHRLVKMKLYPKQ